MGVEPAQKSDSPLKIKDGSHDPDKEIITLSNEDEDDSENGGNIDDEPEDMIQAHFDKVNRTKNKFRCVLSDVMIHINGKDYILKKMTADIEY